MEEEISQTAAGLNCRLKVELVDSSGAVEELAFTIVTAKQADMKSGLLDENTPLARALMGHHAGERIPYEAGDLREVRILAVESGEGDVSPEAARKRREAVRKAVVYSEMTNQMIFSTASGSKWGDYEVNMDKLMEENEEEDGENGEEPGTRA